MQVAGLLHDVIEDTNWSVDDVAERFGPEIAGWVQALADKIASLRYLRITGRRLSDRKRAHYEATLATAAPTAQPRLAGEVADVLDALADRDGASIQAPGIARGRPGVARARPGPA